MNGVERTPVLTNCRKERGTYRVQGSGILFHTISVGDSISFNSEPAGTFC